MAGLYLHIPFCDHKCIYCDFYSIENLAQVDAFLIALEEEISMYAEFGRRRRFETIFFGGGTPSLLTPSQIENILSRLHAVFPIDTGAEITVETNPGTVDATKLAGYRAAGVNRLSIGIQSFHDDELRFLTRIHSAEQAKQCVRAAQRVGFANINIDLIFALPNQTLPRWQSNLRQALELEPQHLSAYSLTVEKGTPLGRMVAAKQIFPVPAELDAVLFEWTMQALAEAGYEHYEVSNFARPGFRSRHNSNYWNHTDYLGFGPSAHSFFMNGEPQNAPIARRWWNIADIGKYLERIHSGKPPVVGTEILEEQQLLEEAVMLGLRSDGITWERIEGRSGAGFRQASRGFVHQLVAEGLALADDAGFRLTDRGYLVCDEIVKKLLAVSRDDVRKGHVLENERMSILQDRQMSTPALTLADGFAVS